VSAPRQPDRILTSPAADGHWAGHALGITYEGEAIPGLNRGAAPSSGRHARVRVSDHARVSASWDPRGAERVVDRRRPGGERFLAIDFHPAQGYRIDAPGHGLHVVSGDGRAVHLSTLTAPAWRSELLLVAQTFPLVAVLQGLEVFHAGGVSIGDSVFGLVGRSGVGKSSVACHLIAQGAGFFTDDVLALEHVHERLVVHPGPRFVNVHEHERQAVEEPRRARLGATLGHSDKLHLRPDGDGRLRPLGGLLMLRRPAPVSGVRLSPQDPVDPRELLASAFVTYVQSADRLTAHLELCAVVARRSLTHTVSIGSRASAADVAARILRYLHER